MADNRLKELLEAGAHFGHQTRRWNPKMDAFIFGVRGGVHIIDLTKTVDKLEAATNFARQTAEEGSKVLLVGTKRQARAIVADEAAQADMPYVTERWLGGMLTNYRTIRDRINHLKKLEAGLESGDFNAKYNKKEVLDFTNEAEALQKTFGGIKNMDDLPGALFVVDAIRDNIAINEARTLGIPVIAISDTNTDPDLVDYPIPANDDALKSIRLITHIIAEAASEGAAAHAKKAAAQPKDEAPEPQVPVKASKEEVAPAEQSAPATK